MATCSGELSTPQGSDAAPQPRAERKKVLSVLSFIEDAGRPSDTRGQPSRLQTRSASCRTWVGWSPPSSPGGSPLRCTSIRPGAHSLPSSPYSSWRQSSRMRKGPPGCPLCGDPWCFKLECCPVVLPATTPPMPPVPRMKRPELYDQILLHGWSPGAGEAGAGEAGGCTTAFQEGNSGQDGQAAGDSMTVGPGGSLVHAQPEPAAKDGAELVAMAALAAAEQLQPGHGPLGLSRERLLSAEVLPAEGVGVRSHHPPGSSPTAGPQLFTPTPPQSPQAHAPAKASTPSAQYAPSAHSRPVTARHAAGNGGGPAGQWIPAAAPGAPHTTVSVGKVAAVRGSGSRAGQALRPNSLRRSQKTHKSKTTPPSGAQVLYSQPQALAMTDRGQSLVPTTWASVGTVDKAAYFRPVHQPSLLSQPQCRPSTLPLYPHRPSSARLWSSSPSVTAYPGLASAAGPGQAPGPPASAPASVTGGRSVKVTVQEPAGRETDPSCSWGRPNVQPPEGAHPDDPCAPLGQAGQAKPGTAADHCAVPTPSPPASPLVEVFRRSVAASRPTTAAASTAKHRQVHQQFMASMWRELQATQTISQAGLLTRTAPPPRHEGYQGAPNSWGQRKGAARYASPPSAPTGHDRSLGALLVAPGCTTQMLMHKTQAKR